VPRATLSSAVTKTSGSVLEETALVTAISLVLGRKARNTARESHHLGLILYLLNAPPMQQKRDVSLRAVTKALIACLTFMVMFELTSHEGRYRFSIKNRRCPTRAAEPPPIQFDAATDQ